MKRWQQVVSLLGITLFLAAAAVAAEKVALISLTDVIEQLPQHQELVRQLRSQFGARTSELQLMEQRMTEKLKKLQRDAPTMQRGEREKLEKEVTDLREQFANKAQKFEQQSRQQQLEMQEAILKEIRQAAQQVAKQQGYTVVLDASAVIYADAAKDITKEVIGAFKK